jgi:glycosyltransferase involved in cell wall biosynthesis
MIIAVIPCLNESKYLAEVIDKAKKYTDKVIVSDDGSSDDTVDVALSHGAEIVLSNGVHGAGINTWGGIHRAILNNADVIVTLDGDGQHNADEIPLVVQPIIDNKADLVIGSRYLDSKNNMPVYRKLGITLITRICNLKYRKKIADGQSCFRAYNRRILNDISPFQEKGFAFSVETLIKAKSFGYRIVEVPITCIYHKEFGGNSSLNPLKHGVIVFWGVLRWRYKLELIPRVKKRIFKLKKIFK